MMLRFICALLVFIPAAISQIPKPDDAPRPLSPEQSAAAFKLPPGFRMELIASEPLIASPSGVCWDEKGRMFVSELHGYNLEGQLDIEELNRSGQLDTKVRRVQADEKFKRAAESGTYGAVKLLLDTNRDGRMDKSVTWATNIPPAYGLVPARGGVIVACAPHIMFLADHDGDGVAEVQEKLFTGFRTGALERGINAPQWGIDGWIYFGRGWGGGKITGPRLEAPISLPDSDFRIRSDGTAIEPVTGRTHTFGFAMTEGGSRFTTTTTVPGIYVAPLPWRYLARNPDAATGSLEAPTGDRRAYSISKPHPWRQKRADDPAYFNYYKSRYGAAESEAAGWFTAACGPLIYQDDTLPGLQGQYFVCEPSGNLIHRAIIEQDGSELKLRRPPGEEHSEFAASTDQWSHPMNLTHGPDGCIWVVDYYREIIEDYSAIPRHLQQQYGVYHGHDRGRIYRLTQDKRKPAPNPDLSRLQPEALAAECASRLFWRRQTAQRLLLEKDNTNAAAPLRQMLGDTNALSSALIVALRTLDGFGALTPPDVEPFIKQHDASVRIHALQLSDKWFTNSSGKSLFETVLNAANAETNPLVQIQFALSMGETRDPRGFAALARFGREDLSTRWMDAAILSSLNERTLEMLAELIREPGQGQTLLPMLAQSIAASRDDFQLKEALKLAAEAKPTAGASIVTGLANGRKNNRRKGAAKKETRILLAKLAASPSAEVRKATRALEETWTPITIEDESFAPSTNSPAEVPISEAIFKTYLTALTGKRDNNHGHQIFVQACAACHRIGKEGHDVGPDLMGQLGMGEEALLKEILTPNERIRPGYETVTVQLNDGATAIGILKDEGATSLTLVAGSGLTQEILRKDVKTVQRTATSIMPSFATGLTPKDIADLLSWLRSNNH